MHLQYLAILPVTALTAIGYLVLHAALTSQGKMQTLGKILAGWLFVLAVLVAVVAITRPFHGDRPMRGYHHGMMERPMNGERPAPAPSAPPLPESGDTPPP